MADETYRPRKVIQSDEFEANYEQEVPPRGTPVPQRKTERMSGREMLAKGQAIRDQLANDADVELPQPPMEGLEISGNMPPELERELIHSRGDNSVMKPKTRRENNVREERKQALSAPEEPSLSTNSAVKDLLNRVKKFTEFHYDEIHLPSKGNFYDGTDGPADGILHIRPMTGHEEQILATSRWQRNGKAIDMIYEKCIQESYDPVNLLSIDRTYILIFLRGISYTPDYEVEIKCPDCGTKYSSVIHLEELELDECPDDFGPEKLNDTLPTTKFSFGYRLSTGRDEIEVNKHKERKNKWFGERANDDTLLFRLANLIEYIEDVDNKKDIQTILEKLPVSDVNYIRNVINEPPFGVDTKIPQLCISCMSEFDIDLPVESNFFFPRRVKEQE